MVIIQVAPAIISIRYSMRLERAHLAGVAGGTKIGATAGGQDRLSRSPSGSILAFGMPAWTGPQTLAEWICVMCAMAHACLWVQYGTDVQYMGSTVLAQYISTSAMCLGIVTCSHRAGHERCRAGRQ